MDSIFCCSQIKPYRPQRIDHELDFQAFLAWAQTSTSESAVTVPNLQLEFEKDSSYVVQVVKQVNYGPVESKRYFITNRSPAGTRSFHEVTENDLVEANYKKLNS